MHGSSMLGCGGEHWNAHLHSWDDSTGFRRHCSSLRRGCARRDGLLGPRRLLGFSGERIGKRKSPLLGQLQGCVRLVPWRRRCGSRLHSRWRQPGQRQLMLGTNSRDSASSCCCGCRHAHGTALEKAPVICQRPRHSPFQDRRRRAAAALHACRGGDPLPPGMAIGECLQETCASSHQARYLPRVDSVITLQHQQHSIWRSKQHQQA